MIRLVAVLGLLLGASVFAATEASAYPVTTCASLALSTTTPYVGETIEVSGSGYLPNENVKLYIGGKLTGTGCHIALSDGQFVGTAHTNGSGAFDPSVKVPNLLGNQPVTGIGASGQPTDKAASAIVIRARQGVTPVAPNGGGSSSGGGGGLAFTGVEIAAMIAAAVALLAVGGSMAYAGRRKKQHRLVRSSAL